VLKVIAGLLNEFRRGREELRFFPFLKELAMFVRSLGEHEGTASRYFHTSCRLLITHELAKEAQVDLRCTDRAGVLISDEVVAGLRNVKVRMLAAHS